ncbi:putative quinol monooxygenase [Ancylomarina longa]|uniref:Antibiotic biosynthesis monooxygenase n=1 Tax=Ancylomarina longa TaxID=2487017 RepID=A0A434ATM5_9BACT|nr:antibiotic biosynthesis monooxygenase family protein [Ancylomarina longa]RUT77680.1 antibiotic biosynthesis monooxygenase [Ancylomarina longa]
MITRFVKLEILSDHIEDFKTLTTGEKTEIIAFPGCSHLKILQDVSKPSVFFTVSHWESETALNHYRNSDFFQGNWKTVKQWFASKPEAWSLS